MRTLRVATATLLGIGLAASSLGLSGSASAAPRTSVNNCGELEVKPTDLVLACADANAMLTDLKWSGWSNGRAKATGTYEVNDCTPTCVAGKTRAYPVRVKLDRPKVQSGSRVFTLVVVTYVKATPTGRPSGTFRLGAYSPEQAAPSPSVTAAPAPAAPAAPAPTASAAPTATATATPTATPTVTPTPTPTVAAGTVPVAALVKSERFQSSKLRLSITATSSAGGDRKGIRSVTVYRPNEYNAELDTKASYTGAETANQDEWTAILSCDATARFKDTLRIVVTANDGATTTLRGNVTPTSC